jgi:putative DNA primase/helicase
VRFNHSTGHWLLWAGTHWRGDDDGAIQRRAKATVRAIYDEAAAASRAGDDEYAGMLAKWARASAAEARRNALLTLAQSELPIPVTHARLNRHARLLNVQNGTLDLATGQLRAHARDDLLTTVLPVAYDPAATCPTWDRFLARITGGDDALAGYLARAAGYTLSGLTDEQCLFFLYGHGANGKSTFIETALALLGELGHKARAQILMADERERVPNEIAALAGKRLVVASELAEGSRLNEGLVKDMTGGDSLSARFLYGEPFTFRPAFKLWLYGNHKPVITGTDDGIWRRVRLIPFTVQIPEAERDAGLPGRLRAELPGILAWAVRGWAAYQRQGLGAPAAVTQATAAYRGESDLIGVFLDERCVTGAGLTVGAGELYAAYGEWATANGLRALSNVRFSRALAERGMTKTRAGGGRREYAGLGLTASP